MSPSIGRRAAEGTGAVILTDGNGVPIHRPRRIDYQNDGSFLRAHWEWDNRVRAVANASFTSAFRAAMKVSP